MCAWWVVHYKHKVPDAILEAAKAAPAQQSVEMGARINLESGQRLAQPLLHPRRLWNWGWDFRRCSIE